ncbi:endonuclease/exonuclease/phosphatase family protein, partial [Ostertagia ostertagi]
MYDARLKCLLTNIRSLSKNIGDLLFRIRDGNFSVVALTETWLSDVISNESLFGEYCRQYEILRCDRSDKRGGGVAVIASKIFYPRIIFKESIDNSYEIMVVDLDMAYSKVRAPSCPISMFEQLLKAIGDMVCTDSHFILLGDFNLPDISWRQGVSPKANGPRALRFIELCRSLDLHQLIFEGTHGSNTLDLLLVNNMELVTSTQVLAPIGGSDHASVLFELNIEAEYRVNTVFKRDFRTANFDVIIEYLNNVDWYGSFNSVDTVNDKYEIFLAILHHAIELFVPLKAQKTSVDQLPQHLIRYSRKKNLAWNKAVASDNPENWDKYKKISAIFEKRVNKFRSRIERNVINSRNKNAFYRLLNSKLKKSKGLGVLFAEDGRAVCRDEDKAELLASIFEKAYQKGVEVSEVPTRVNSPELEDSPVKHYQHSCVLLQRG